MLPPGPEKVLAATVARMMHAGQKRDAALAIADACRIPLKLSDDNPAKYLPVLQNYLHVLLESDAPEEAAQMLWTPSLFNPEPQSTKDIWKLYSESNQGLIMGAGSMSKSYSMGVRLFLEYCRDPEYTAVRVVGPSEDHLETNLFSHLVRLHDMATLPMPGEIGELFIGKSRRNQVGAIKGLVIPVGKTKKAGRIQGTKRVPRPVPHYKFGALTRLFIFIDEIENVPAGVWGDIDNVLSQIEKDGEVGGFKIFGAYNPRNQRDEVGQRAEPPFGWETFDVDKHFRWRSTRGWNVLRLDGERSENVVADKIVYQGLQTRAGLEAIALNAGGRNSPGYYTMGRGAYPPQGVELAVVPPGMLNKMRGEFIWLDKPVPVASCDMALEGGAGAVYTLGLWGQATGVKLPPSMEFPHGRIIIFRDSTASRTVTRWGLQATQQFTLPKGDTVAMATKLIEVNKRAGVKPEFFACDRTGNGAGVADIMKNDWSAAIHDVNYSNSPSETKLMSEDSKTCAEEFDRICCELWFGLRNYGEFGYLLLHPQMDLSKLAIQLTQRKYKSGKKKKVESKKDYVSRGHESPDEGDSLCLFVFAGRKGSGVILSMKGDDTSIPTLEEFDGWADERQLRGGAYVDFTNRTDYLESAGEPVM